MAQFFKFVLATVVGLVLFSVLGFIVLVGAIAAIGASSPNKSVAANSVLELKLNKPISERSQSADPLGGSSSLGLVGLKDVIKRAKTDDDIKGILLNLELVQGGMASLEEVRDALLDFKK